MIMIKFSSFVDCIYFVYILGTQGALSTRSSTCWLRHRFRMKVEGVSMSGDAPGREMSFCLFFYQIVTDKGARRMYVCSDLENDANLA